MLGKNIGLFGKPDFSGAMLVSRRLYNQQISSCTFNGDDIGYDSDYIKHVSVLRPYLL